MKKPVYYVILALLIGVFLFAAYKVGSYYLEKYRSDKVISDATRFVTLPGEDNSTDNPDSDPGGDPECPTVQFDELKQQNEDVIAWIYGANTHINYPVVQGSDNDYYLRRDEKGNKNYHGSIYADYACRMDSSEKVSRNLIFYGHTFTDEEYICGFEDLHKYRVFEFGQENPYIYVSLADEKLTYQIFSVWVCDANADTDCIQADPDDAAFQQILDKVVAGCAIMVWT